MDAESEDHVLNVLRSLASGAELSVGLRITVLCGPARIEAERLREVDATDDTAEVADLEHEEQHLGELTPILILRDALVWGPGSNPLGAADQEPFVRIPVAAISAWWLGPG
jgi:hypothetical protein